MNRGYTVEEYLEFTDRVLRHLPDASIAGDIIVGFPTETDEDFEATKDLLRRVPFKNNFIFKYSPRPGTTAIDRFEDDVPEAVKKLRNNELLALQAEIGAAVHADWIGREVDVLVERKTDYRRRKAAPRSSADERVNLGTGIAVGSAATVDATPEPIQLSGRTKGDLITVFDVPDTATAEAMIGGIARVKVDGSGPLLLRGTLIEGS